MPTQCMHPIPPRDDLLKMYSTLSDAQIADNLGVSATTVRRWRRSLQIPSKPRGPVCVRHTRVTDDDLRLLVRNVYSVAGVLRALGLSDHGSSHAVMRDRLLRLGVDLSHFGKQRERLLGTNGYTYPLDHWLTVGVRCCGSRLKRRLIREGLLTDLCSICGQGVVWNGHPLVLQLDHIDGDPTNNTLTNLRILCPNCHTQTATFTARNRKSKPR